ncbi:DUF2064 domain-containing protein [Arthrobacter sp. NA-172]|uniref:TIGR04282 family arsenosugar biosynthesis glycosyltransferase n=1 Tax=Arthrobacter sp. NA-172 TaxID=3367524 RepID=UPI003754A1EA
MMNLTIAVVAKECLPGRVKTRLTPPLTPGGAALLAQLSLSMTLESVRSFPARRRLLVMDGKPRDCDAAGFTVQEQVPGSLDTRLAAIFDSVRGPLLLVGMDTPQLSTEHLEPLFLDWATDSPRHGAWFGPAYDGGFWALAMLRPRGELIRGVEMSTGSTGAKQLGRLHAAGQRTGVLPRLRDMDSFGDAMDIAADLPGTEFAAAVQASAVEFAVGRPS